MFIVQKVTMLQLIHNCLSTLCLSIFLLLTFAGTELGPHALATADTTTVTKTNEKCRIDPIDLVLIVDGSASVKRKNFDKGLEFLSNLVRGLPDKTRVSFVQFSSKFTWEFTYDQISGNENIANKILSTKYQQGTSTYTGLTLRVVRKWLQKQVPANPGTNFTMIVMTDGAASDWKARNAEKQLDIIHNDLNLITWSIGIGNDLSETELEKIAGSPNRKLTIEDYDSMNDVLLDALTTKVCQEVKKEENSGGDSSENSDDGTDGGAGGDDGGNSGGNGGGNIDWKKSNWAFGCDFTNEKANFKNAKMRGEDCGGSCTRTSGCTHFAWTPHQGGTCWMKKGRISMNDAVASNKEGIVCGIVAGTPEIETSENSKIDWQEQNWWAFGCDFTNEKANLKNAKMRGEECGGSCSRTSGCTHFAWTPHQGGTCWMKQGRISKSDAVASDKEGIVCGIVVAKS